MINQIKKWATSSLVQSGIIGLVLIALAAYSGVIQSYFDSEEFYVLHYANGFSHVQAWQYFFIENGRLIEGIYWTYLYELFGFNPLLAHSLSFVLLLTLALLATACFLNVWPKNQRWLPYLLVFLFFTNWVSARAVFRLSYDNTHISMIFFFLAGLALQRWAATQNNYWLILGFAVFLVSVLTYENAAFLFPALLLLAWPLLPAAKRGMFRKQLIVFVGLTMISGVLLLFSRWVYSFTQRQHVVTTAIDQSLSSILRAAPIVYVKFGQFLTTGIDNGIIGIGLLSILGLAIMWFIQLVQSPKNSLPSQNRLEWICIVVSCFWFLIFGPLPYIFLGYGPGPRVYSSAIFGVFPLILAVLQNARARLTSLLLVGLIMFLGLTGLRELKRESIAFQQGEASLNIFFRGMKDVVPHVKPNTIFLFVNGPPLGIPGCGPSLEILYNQANIKCGSLISGDPDRSCPAIRHQGAIEVDCQYFDGQNWILIAVAGNVPALLDKLAPDDFDLALIWESTEPLRTDYQKLVTKDLPPPSEFYLNLQERAEVLFNNN